MRTNGHDKLSVALMNIPRGLHLFPKGRVSSVAAICVEWSADRLSVGGIVCGAAAEWQRWWWLG